MYNYVNDISKIAHQIISTYNTSFKVAIDATLGNGHDTDFLSEKFNLVYSFDIQKDAVENYEVRKKENVILINSSHENFKAFIDVKADCIMYNLGFLPRANKDITTTAETTLKSLNEALSMLNPGGIISIVVYIGHEEGKKEKEAIFDFVKMLPKKDYGVLIHTFANRNNSPILIIIEKNSNYN